MWNLLQYASNRTGGSMALQLTSSLSQRIAERIREGIIDGRFQPGERLTESAIVEWLGVSNSPVRDAFHQLEQDGLIVREPRRGARVRQFSDADIRHLYLVRSALDGVAFRLLLEESKSGDEVYRRLQECLIEQEAAAKNGEYALVTEFDLRFHDAIFRSADADVLWSLWAVVRAQFRVLLSWRLQSHQNRGDPVGYSALHHAILDNLRRGDLNALIAGTNRRHGENAEDLVLALQERAQTAGG
jgi:DNA-binding GntR family transcriptional regulator